MKLIPGLALIPLLAFAPLSSAGALSDQGRAVASTSIEGLPEQDGDTWARMRHGLALQANLTPQISLVAGGQLYYPLGSAGTYTWDESTIQRLAFQVTGRALSIRAGRFVHAGTLGLIRVDGFLLDLHPDSPVGGHVWAGRIGHAESISPGGDLGGGFQFRFVPGALGLAAGYDIRKTPVDLAHRIHLSSTVRGKKGVSLFVVAELGFASGAEESEDDEVVPADEFPEGTEDDAADSTAEDDSAGGPGFRATALATIPLGVRARLRVGGKYYGLPPISVPWSSTSVIETIRPTDYGVAHLALDLRPRTGVSIRVEGGPTFGSKTVGYEAAAVDSELPPEIETELGIGATGKLAFDWRGLGFYGTGTAVGGAWYAGGGAGIRHEVGPVELRGEAGLFRFRGLDGSQATVGEARFQGGLTLPVKPSWGEFGLVVRTAVGTDRLLSPWWRLGVAVQGRIGRARGAL
jgi:hypothetical protein